MSALWTAAEAAEATRGRVQGDWTASGVSIDTRTLAPGDLFVALTAERDGHDFAAQALEEGAAAVLVSRIPAGLEDAPLLLVDDTLAALTALGAAGRARSTAQVTGVTGSVGKTGAKEMLRTALGAQGRTHAAEASYNNHWGVPLTLARLPRDAEFAVIEIGMNAPGEIAPLARLARPHVALITTVAAVHLEAFGCVEAIAHEKAAIAEGLEPGGMLILNRDTDTYDAQRATGAAAGATIRSFGEHPQADYRLLEVHLSPGATTARAEHGQDSLIYKLAQPGRHLAANALGVLAAVDALGADLAQAALALAGWQAPEGRGQRWQVALGPAGVDGWVHLIDESFNANPAAMAAAFEVFAMAQPRDGLGRVSRGRRIAFLTDMLELGDTAPALHAGLAAIPALEKVDLVHCAGPLMRNLHDALPPDRRGEWHPTAQALAERLRRLVDAGDVVMCKGSKGSRASLLAETVKKLGTARPLETMDAVFPE